MVIEVVGNSRNLPTIRVISGLSGSGKSRYIAENSFRGDLIVEFDSIMSALSGLEIHDKPESLIKFALAARDAVIGLLDGPCCLARAWISVNDKSEAEKLARYLRAEHIHLEVSETERLRRLGERSHYVIHGH